MISKKLFDIVPQLLSEDRKGLENPTIQHLAFDSREVKNKTLFFAIKGNAGDGHRFIDEAISKGATAIVLESFPSVINKDVTYIKVSDARKALAVSSDLFYDSPSSNIELIGVTGTNGKTTVCTLLYQLFSNMNIKCGLISTVKYAYAEVVENATHTTPDPIKLNALLYRMVQADCDIAFMEVSSHAIDQKRIDQVVFQGGVFTNITHDHLDYHKTFKAYLNVKKKFFDSLGEKAFAVFNADDKNGEVMVQNCSARKIPYSLLTMSEIKGKIISNSIEGLQMMINNQMVFAQMVGRYNAYNLLAAYGVALELGVDPERVLVELSKLRGAEGRFEMVRGEKKKVFGVVDYAHTPDALQNILSTLQSLKKPNSELISVVGCGGDRDKSKRSKMTVIGLQLSDVLIITSDNPRTENPESILDDMESGLDETVDNLIRITDRKQAIKTAVKMAKSGDIILVAGKGHEKYQDIDGVKYPFDDKKILEDFLLIQK